MKKIKIKKSHVVYNFDFYIKIKKYELFTKKL